MNNPGINKFKNPPGFEVDFDLLENLVGHFGVDQLTTTARTPGVIVDPGVVDFVGVKGSSLVALMSRLSASLAFGVRVVLGLGLCGVGLGIGINNITGRWLGGIR